MKKLIYTQMVQVGINQELQGQAFMLLKAKKILKYKRRV